MYTNRLVYQDHKKLIRQGSLYYSYLAKNFLGIMILFFLETFYKLMHFFFKRNMPAQNQESITQNIAVEGKYI